VVCVIKMAAYGRAFELERAGIGVTIGSWVRSGGVSLSESVYLF
jgi:hypothetical protein